MHSIDHGSTLGERGFQQAVRIDGIHRIHLGHQVDVFGPHAHVRRMFGDPFHSALFPLFAQLLPDQEIRPMHDVRHPALRGRRPRTRRTSATSRPAPARTPASSARSAPGQAQLLVRPGRRRRPAAPPRPGRRASARRRRRSGSAPPAAATGGPRAWPAAPRWRRAPAAARPRSTRRPARPSEASAAAALMPSARARNTVVQSPRTSARPDASSSRRRSAPAVMRRFGPNGRHRARRCRRGPAAAAAATAVAAGTGALPGGEQVGRDQHGRAGRPRRSSANARSASASAEVNAPVSAVSASSPITGSTSATRGRSSSGLPAGQHRAPPARRRRRTRRPTRRRRCRPCSARRGR